MSIMNGSYETETNFNILSRDSDVWLGELPYKYGDTFPTSAIQERANMEYTNELLYENDIDKVYKSILSVIPETDIINGWQIREIVGRLPYFRNSVENWVALTMGKTPFINIRGALGPEIEKLINRTNIVSVMTEEVRARFLYGFSVYRIYDSDGRAMIERIPSKNVVLFANKEHTSVIEVVVVFNIYKGSTGSSVCEFLEYHRDGLIRKRAFNYSNRKLGREIKDAFSEGYWIEGVQTSPIIVCRHNNINMNDIYGVDQFRYWDASICGAMRALQNMFRAGERCRELIRKVPSSATQKNNITGQTSFINRGVIEYNENAERTPEVEYVAPDYNMMKAAIDEFEAAMRSVTVDTGLTSVFWSLERAGTNLSAKALEAMLYPTKLRLLMIQNEMSSDIEEIVLKCCRAAGYNDIDETSVSIVWRDAFPKDELEHTKAIMSRLESDHPTLTRKEAIRMLDDISVDAADALVSDIIAENAEYTAYEETEADSVANDVTPSNVNQTLTANEDAAGGGDGAVDNIGGDDIDNPDAPMWEYQVPFPN